MWKAVLERNHINVFCVAIKLRRNHTWELTLERIHINVANVTIVLWIGLILQHAWELILEGSHIKCIFCHYQAAQNCGLVTHMRTHTADQPYKCDQCVYRTAPIGDLATHNRTHIVERSYVIFTVNRSNLECDVSTHIGVKLCSVWPPNFIERSSTNTRDDPYWRETT